MALFPKLMCLTSVNVNSYLVAVKIYVSIFKMKNLLNSEETSISQNKNIHLVQVNHLGWILQPASLSCLEKLALSHYERSANCVDNRDVCRGR